MTPKQVVLVQESWRRLQPMAHAAAALFYNRVFTLDPSLPLLFRGDVQEQGRKLMAMIDRAVRSLSRHRTVPTMQDPVLEEALIWTLRQWLGRAFTREVEDAWRSAKALS